MKAVVYARGKGLNFVRDRARPLVKKGHVLLRVCAAAINPVDYKLPAFLMQGRGVGLDVAGIVVELGEGVRALSLGDAVFGNVRGALAELALCDATKITRKPEALSFAEAAAMPTTYLTGYQALRRHNFRQGSRLLVIGASGGCGTAGVQLGVLMGASEVVGICSRKNEALVLGAGATRIIDYETQDALEVCGRGYFDFVYDTASASGAKESYQALSRALLKKPRPSEGVGMYVCINGGGGAWLRSLLNLQGKANRLLLTQHSGADLDGILSLMAPETQGEAWRCRPIIDRVLPFEAESVVAGFAHLKSRRARGKVVFEMEERPANQDGISLRRV